MCFDKGSITGDYILRTGKHLTFEPRLSIDEQYFRSIVEDNAKYEAYIDVNTRKIIVDKKHIKNKPANLHEMLHAHEFILEKRKPLLKEIVLLELYKDLKPKLSQKNIDIDTWIFAHANIPHNEDLAATTCVLPVCYVAKLRAFADNLYQRKPLKIRYFLKLTSLSSFLNTNRNCHCSTNHWVVTHSNKSHHFYMSRN